MMKQTIKFSFPQIIALTTLLTIGFNACRKDTSGAEVHLAYMMIGDKTWYLEYTQTITSTATTQKTYVGQSTYFINFLMNHTTNDSDGLIGNYTLQKSNAQLQVQVKAKTINGSAVNFTYDIVSLGTKYMVLSYKNGTTTTKLYYSIQK